MGMQGRTYMGGHARYYLHGHVVPSVCERPKDHKAKIQFFALS